MSVNPKVAAIVAMDEQRLIGAGGALPWHLPEDLAHFKKLTMGHIVVMGRKTWESLPPKFRPLPGRINIVVSRNAARLALPNGVLSASSPEAAIALACDIAADEQRIWVIGGAEVYQATLPLCDEVHLTKVRGTYDGDSWFPEFEGNFRIESETPGVQCSFVVFVRILDASQK